MATKSMLKNIVVKDRRAVSRLIGAVERSEKRSAGYTEKTPNYQVASSRQIKSIFGGTNY